MRAPDFTSPWQPILRGLAVSGDSRAGMLHRCVGAP
jgi:hypothetical protein